MSKIVSKRHRLRFYGALFLLVMFCFLLGTAILVIFYKLYQTEIRRFRDYFLLALGIGAYSGIFTSIYTYYRCVPIIQINDHEITFNRETYALDEIEHVELTGTGDFANLSFEAATLKFRDGRTRCVFDDMYENSGELKSFLKQVVVEKQSYTNSEPCLVGSREPKNETFENYRGNPIFSYEGVYLWMPIGFMLVAWINGSKGVPTDNRIILLVLMLSWFPILAWIMNFFKVSSNYFIVRNKYFFWQTKVFKLSDIQEIVYVPGIRLPDAVRVITKDFKNRRFWAGSLTDKTWLRLKDHLESYGITVRD